MPDFDDTLRDLTRTREGLVAENLEVARLRAEHARLATERARHLGTGDSRRVEAVTRRIREAENELSQRLRDRDRLLEHVTDLSDRLVGLKSHEELVATLEGAVPVAMLPVRIETRFAGRTSLMVRIFPDQIQVDTHDPALTADEIEAGRWYWSERWRAGLADEEAARVAWEVLVSRFRPGRASYVVRATTPTNTPADGPPEHPEVAERESAWSRAAVASALPDRFCVVGFSEVDGGWRERFRKWADSAVPDQLAVGPDPHAMTAATTPGALPQDEGTRWLRELKPARDKGVLIEVADASLADGVDRLVVVGVDWTRSPEDAAAAVDALLQAQQYAGHLGFVAQGTPTNNTSQDRSGMSTDPALEAELLDPARSPLPGDEHSAGVLLARALGLSDDALADVPGADLREHAWAAGLTDVLWRATAGYYLTVMLNPLAAEDPQIDADLRDFIGRHVQACGPLPTLRVGSQPYGVLPVTSWRSYDPGPRRVHGLVHRVTSTLRQIIRPALGKVPHLRRAGEQEDADKVLLALLQRTPVPWSFRFRPVTGPIEQKLVSFSPAGRAFVQQTWSTALWNGLGVHTNLRLWELTHGEDHPLRAPLVAAPGAELPTGYLGQIADLTTQPHGRKALNLHENAVTLLEALAACSAVLELDRAALQAARDVAENLAASMADLPALRALAIPTPESVRVEPQPGAPRPLLDFRTGRQLADAIVPQLSATTPVGEFVATRFGERLGDLGALIGAPTDAFHWLARHQVGLRTLAEAPVDQLEWAFRGHLDLYATRLDAWFTGLASARLSEHRERTPRGVHLGCWGFVENLRRDTGVAAESLGYVHTPSLAHAVSTALLRNGRMASTGAGGDAFDLQITSDRVRRAQWLLDGVAQGQRLAALLGYRIERLLREAGPELMRYQMPLRRVAPLLGPDSVLDEPTEVLAARDVVDGVAVLDRWQEDPGGLIGAIAAEAGIASWPTGHEPSLRGVLADAYDSYDAVSDLLVAEAVHQTALGNLERAGAALAAHDRHGRSAELDYIASPRSGHTVGHRVLVLVQPGGPATGWPSDARSQAEPLLDAWAARLLGKPADWRFAARTTSAAGGETVLSPISLADLGLGALSVALASQRTDADRPSELEQRAALAFAARTPADPDVVLELLPDPPAGAAGGGLALLATLGEWIADLAGGAAVTPADLTSAADVAAGDVAGSDGNPGSVDVAELGGRVAAVRDRLGAALTALRSAGTSLQRERALLGAVPFDGLDAVPRVPRNHAAAGAELADQVAEVRARLEALEAAVDTALADAAPVDPTQAVSRSTTVLRTMLGNAQPVLPRWTLADPKPLAASLADRAALLGGDDTAPVTWLHRSALVRPDLDPLADLLMHDEAGGADVTDRLHVVQQPHRPGAPWLAGPFGKSDPPPHGSVGVVVHSSRPLDPAKPFAGVVVDAWTETLPATAETTAVTFHYDAPGARAPQSVLLAVHPRRDPGTWSLDLLLETVNEAADLARLRMLSSAELAPLGTILPALYLPDDYTHDIPSVSFHRLLEHLRLQGLLSETDVLGKG